MHMYVFTITPVFIFKKVMTVYVFTITLVITSAFSKIYVCNYGDKVLSTKYLT